MIGVDLPAIAFRVRWRRDAEQPWQTIEVPAYGSGRQQIARLGWNGCSSNFEPAILDRGMDLEIVAILADGGKLDLDPISGGDVRALTALDGLP